MEDEPVPIPPDPQQDPQDPTYFGMWIRESGKISFVLPKDETEERAQALMAIISVATAQALLPVFDEIHGQVLRQEITLSEGSMRIFGLMRDAIFREVKDILRAPSRRRTSQSDIDRMKRWFGKGFEN